MFIELNEFENEGEFSIAISVARTRHGNHTGILTKYNNEIKFFHLAWHLKMLCDNWSDYINDPAFLLKRWINFTSLTEDSIVAAYRVPSIIKLLELVFSKSHDTIPYALNFRETKFTDNGEVEFGDHENGLTCATFVASFFNSVGVNIVDINTWISREPEDSEWKSSILDFMNRHGVSYAHIANVWKEELNYRLKPEEIAVGSIKKEDELPADFAFCSTAGAIFNTL